MNTCSTKFERIKRIFVGGWAEDDVVVMFGLVQNSVFLSHRWKEGFGGSPPMAKGEGKRSCQPVHAADPSLWGENELVIPGGKLNIGSK